MARAIKVMAPKLWEILDKWLSINKKKENGEENTESGYIGDEDLDEGAWEENSLEGIIEMITEDGTGCEARKKARKEAIITVVCGKPDFEYLVFVLMYSWVRKRSLLSVSSCRVPTRRSMH